MDKVGVLLLAVSPFLGFYAWLSWWLVADAFRERKRLLAVVRDLCEQRRDVARSVGEAA